MNSAIENMPVAYTKLTFPKNRSKPVHISKENKLSPEAKLTFPKNRTKTDRKTDRQADKQTDNQTAAKLQVTKWTPKLFR